MTVKVLLDVMSQPSRAVLIFCRAAKIPHELQQIMIKKQEHKSPEFTKIQPFQTVPAMVESDGFAIRDSSAILRYLSAKPDVDEHWYPKDPKGQARVDEYLHWQHANTRASCAMYFQKAWLLPLLNGTEPDEKTVQKQRKLVEQCLDKIEKVWLENGKKKYICGDKISVADIMACCELEQPAVAGLDVRDGRPILADYMARVRRELNPHYDEVHKVLYNFRERFAPKAKL